MNMSRAALVGAALCAGLLLAPSQSFAKGTCAIVEGTHRYNSAGENVSRCSAMSQRKHYKVVSTRKVSEPRCAGKRAGYSFIRNSGGHLYQIVCKGAGR